jgi:hypothetical protein
MPQRGATVLEIFNAVFYSFWTFTGTAILLSILVGGAASIASTALALVRR